MINSSKVEHKGGLIIYQLNDDEDDNNNEDSLKNGADNHDTHQNQESTLHRLDEIFDEMVDDTPLSASKKKITVVLDGANIGWGFGNDHFSVNGIILAQRYFTEKLHHDDREVSVITFIPSHYIRRKPHHLSKQHHKDHNILMESDELDQLTTMMINGSITLVPSGDNDDVYIIAYARENEGFIVSNDLYADHIRGIENKHTRQAMRAWLHQYRCGYAFVGPSHAKEFMLNPSNTLSYALSSSSQADTAHASIFQPHMIMSYPHDHHPMSVLHLSVQPHLQYSLPSIHALSSTISILAEQQLYVELKHVLLARSYALLRHHFIYDGRRDLEFILTQLDTNCAEAISLLQNLHVA